jgi:hypothetical protein
VRTRRGRRRWLTTVSGGWLALLVFGLVLAVTGTK